MGLRSGTVTITGVVSNAALHGAKEDAKAEAKERGMDKSSTEYGHMTVTHLKMASETTDRMKDSPGPHFKTYFFILLMVLFTPLGNVLLGKGMKGIGSAKDWTPSDIFHVFVSIMTSSSIWLGIACLLASFMAYMLVLTWADYSYVQPASSFSYAVVATLGYFILGETVNPLRWTGIIIICAGVFVVGHTQPRTTEKR